MPIAPPLASHSSTNDGPFTRRLEEISMFFNGTDRVHQTLKRVADRLESAGIPYAVLGGMAVNAHGHQRTTADVDFLLSAPGLTAFLALVRAGEFANIPGRPRRFVDPVTGVTFDLLITGMFPGSGRPGPIAFPDPAEVSQVIEERAVVNLPMLVQLKLAARRHRDFDDVVNLIRVHGLEESFQENLHPAVRRDYIECLEEKRREDEYEARQDEDFESRR
jgi:hypothetical protein